MLILAEILLSVLQFGSPLLLGWLAALALPFVIHRWSQRQKEEIPWAAVELLQRAMRVRARSARLENLLLLALRIALLAALVLAAAEPKWRSSKSYSATHLPIHHILVFDQSYSMASIAGRESHFAQARRRARKIVQASKEEDRFTLILWNKKVENLFGRAISNQETVLSSIERLEPSRSPANLRPAIDAVLLELQSTEELSQKHVTFFTDLGRNTWQDATEYQKQFERMQEQATIEIINMADTPADNVAVVDLKVQPTTIFQTREAVFIARIQQFGKKSWKQLPVHMSVDGKRVEEKVIDLVEDQQALVEFSHRFTQPGYHSVRVTAVAEEDPLHLDNSRWLVAQVLPHLRVTCLAGEPNAAEDIARALVPNPEERGNSTFELSVEPLGRLSEMDLSEYDAILVCGAQELLPDETGRLARFANSGGGLAFFLGDVSTPESFAQRAPDAAQDAILPVHIGRTVETGQYQLDSLDLQHPMLEVFRGRQQTGFNEVLVRRYRRLRLDSEQSAAETVLQFSTGDPALVVGKSGLGRVAVMALPCSLAYRGEEGTPWSTFPVSPTFLPVMRELVTFLVADRQQLHSVKVGQYAVVPFEGHGTLGEVNITSPTGEQRTTLPKLQQEGSVLEFGDTEEAGVYTFSAEEKVVSRIAVNLDTSESDLRGVPRSFLPISSPPATDKEVPTAATVVSFVPALLSLVVILFISELVVAFWIGRKWG